MSGVAGVSRSRSFAGVSDAPPVLTAGEPSTPIPGVSGPSSPSLVPPSPPTPVPVGLSEIVSRCSSPGITIQGSSPLPFRRRRTITFPHEGSSNSTVCADGPTDALV